MADRVQNPTAMQVARDDVVAAARRFSDCVAEFEGDLSCCAEHTEALWVAFERLKAAEESGNAR